MIVDVHSHMADGDLHITDEFKADLGESWKGTTIDAPPEVHRQAVAAVDAIIVFPLYAPYSGIVVPNEYVADYVRGAGDNVIGFASVDANDADAPDQLEHAAKNLGLRGLKIGPIYQNYDPLGEGALAMFAKAETLGLPVMWHHGTTFVRKAPLKYTQPYQVDEIAIRFPDLKVIVAHMGHPGIGETVSVVLKQPNVYTDISGLYPRPWLYYNALITAVEYGTADKLLFGTDFPLFTAADTIAGLRNVNAFVEGTALPRVPEDVIEGIIHRESLTLLGLD
ncbi:MAG: amidohydrolase family protein [Chloroflexota bacterium]|nr:amidohydrolase family protein [Chloroflexota bacterium]